MGLVQAALENGEIATSSITLLPEITAKIGVPRALDVPYPLGYPFGKAGAPELQSQILRQALRLAERDELPVLEGFEVGP